MELGRKKGGEIEREEGGETAVAMKNKWKQLNKKSRYLCHECYGKECTDIPIHIIHILSFSFEDESTAGSQMEAALSGANNSTEKLLWIPNLLTSNFPL